MKPKRIIRHHHTYRKCNECGKERRHISYCWGHWLCRICMKKSILGEPNKKFAFEHSVMKKRLRMPYLTDSDYKFLYAKYYKENLAKYEIKKRLFALRGRLVLAHKRYVTALQEQEAMKPQKILSEEMLERR